MYQNKPLYIYCFATLVIFFQQPKPTGDNSHVGGSCYQFVCRIYTLCTILNKFICIFNPLLVKNIQLSLVVSFLFHEEIWFRNFFPARLVPLEYMRCFRATPGVAWKQQIFRKHYKLRILSLYCCFVFLIIYYSFSCAGRD